MKKFTKLAFTGLLLACASTGYAGGGGHADRVCIPVDGTVTTTPITCGDVPPEVTSALCPAGVGLYPGMCLPEDLLPAVCFRIAGKGKAKIEGATSFSRLTTALVVNPFLPPPNVSATPLGFAVPPDNARSDLTVFTSNAVLTGKVRNYSGNLYTQDSGVITAAGLVGQVLKIVGGTDDFMGATGEIAVAGQEVGGGAFFTGDVCVKPKK